ncbi:MAG TPA: class I adenylate-forming enzyme family protein [Acidimicrobiales bacterium]|nr:class I adenylate-forming enzyme family protein [Acidimicrobiales bacterium]
MSDPGLSTLEPAAAEEAQGRAAGALVAAGLGPGDRVAFCLPSSASLLLCVLGALRRGVVPVLLNATLLPAERDALVADAEPSLTVFDAAGLATLLAGRRADLAPYPLARPMHYTSGTTGRAKGVWSGVLGDDDARRLFEDEADLWAFDASDTHLVCSPMYHSVSVRFAAGTLLRGGRLVILSRFDPTVVAAAVRRYRPTTTFLAPTALQRLLEHDDAVAGDGATDLWGSFRLIVHAGSPCPPALKRVALERAPEGAVWEFYGSTEGQFTVCGPDEWMERPGTVGRARPGRRLRVDHDGTVWCRPPSFARFRYWHDDDATDRAWRGDEFTVGDLGRLDPDGYLFLDGRRDDLVITGGVNVYPAEVESVLAEAPGVVEAAVFGIADETWGERVCAAVVGPVGEAALRRHVADRLAPYKRPKTYFLVDDLPRTSTGKLRRRALPTILGLDEPPPGPGVGPGR